jgi:hypothetical protein
MFGLYQVGYGLFAKEEVQPKYAEIPYAYHLTEASVWCELSVTLPKR